jgi:predicted PurR-regulated permease PerM
MVAVLAALIVLGQSVMVPLLVSFALAVMIEPLVEWFERRRWSRHSSVLLALGVSTLAVLLVILFLVPGIVREVRQIGVQAPRAVEASKELVHRGLENIRMRYGSDAVDRAEELLAEINPGTVLQYVGTWLLEGAFGILNFGSWALGMLIVPFFVYYLLLDFDEVRRGIDERIPPRFRAEGVRLMDEIGVVVRGYVQGRFLVSVGMTTFYAIGLRVIGIPFAFGIGIVAGFIGIIPYLGVVAGIVMAVAIAALENAVLWQYIGIAVVFSLAQLLEDYVLTPRLIGDRLDVHPMLVFIALIIAGDLFGILGLVLAIPVVAIGKVVLKFLDDVYRASEFYTGLSREPALAGTAPSPGIAPGGDEPSMPASSSNQRQSAPTTRRDT